jgi:hypothetical protein
MTIVGFQRRCPARVVVHQRSTLLLLNLQRPAQALGDSAGHQRRQAGSRSLSRHARGASRVLHSVRAPRDSYGSCWEECARCRCEPQTAVAVALGTRTSSRPAHCDDAKQPSLAAGACRAWQGPHTSGPAGRKCSGSGTTPCQRKPGTGRRSGRLQAPPAMLGRPQRGRGNLARTQQEGTARVTRACVRGQARFLTAVERRRSQDGGQEHNGNHQRL